MSMNVLALGKFYPPYRGGMETLLAAWSEAFVARGATVDAVVANTRAKTEVSVEKGVRVHRLASWGSFWSVSLCPAYPWITRRMPADIWHAHFPNPLADMACLLGSKRTPLVLHYHSDIVRQASAMRVYAPILRRLLRRADRIVVATPRHIEFSDWLPPYRDKCEVIPFGLNLDQFGLTPAREAEVARLRTEAGGKTIILNIGRLVPYKGQRYLLEAARGLDAVVWIVGDGPLRTELETQAAELGLGNKIRFWGDVDAGFLISLLHACHVFALPSITPNEAFGLVQIEAMACGKPVVACDLKSGVPFVNQHQISGLNVPPMNAARLHEALAELVNEPGRRAALGAGALARARTEFDARVMVDRYWGLLQRLHRPERHPQ